MYHRRALVAACFFVVAMCLPGMDCSKEKGGRLEKSAAAKQNVTVAALPELKEDPQARARLAELLHAMLERRRSIGGNPAAATTAKEVGELAAFAASNPRTKAALLAKFMLAAVPFFATGGKSADAYKECLEDLARDYPGTMEAALARVHLLWDSHERARISGDQAKYLHCLAKYRDALRDALPLVLEMDEERSEFAAAVRALLLGSRDDRFVPQLRLDMAGTTADMGQVKEAQALYEQVIRDYPGTPWACTAKLGIDNLANTGEAKASAKR